MKIPNNAQAGDYVAQLTINPSWTSTVAPTSPSTGPWNNAQYGLLTPGNTNNKSLLSTVLGLFGVETASARLQYIQEETLDPTEGGGGGGSGSGGTTTPPPPPPCGTSWWCDIQFYGVPMSEPFTVNSLNTPPSIQIR